jgi:hypothetical protein
VTTNSQKDRAVSWILATIWFGAVLLVMVIRDDVPVYLLAIGTLFFLMLLPSMRELVRNVENHFADKQDDKVAGREDHEA